MNPQDLSFEAVFNNKPAANDNVDLSFESVFGTSDPQQSQANMSWLQMYESLTPEDVESDPDRAKLFQTRAIGESVLDYAKDWVRSGKELEEFDEEYLHSMLNDEFKEKYVDPEEWNTYDRLRSTLISKQDIKREEGMFGGIDFYGSEDIVGEVADVGRSAISGLTTAVTGTVSALGRAYRWYASEDAPPMGILDPISAFKWAKKVFGDDDPAVQKVQAALDAAGKGVESAAVSVSDVIDETLLPYLENDLLRNRVAEINQELSDPRTWIQSTAKGAGQMVPILAAAALTGGAGAMAFGFGMGADQIYDGVRDVLNKDPNLSEEEKDRIARDYAVKGGAVSAALETIGALKILGTGGKGLSAVDYFRDVLSASVAEGLTEAAQTSLEQTLNFMADPTIPTKTRGDIAKKFLENLATSETALAAGTGAIVGGGFAAGVGGAKKIKEDRLASRMIEGYSRERDAKPETETETIEDPATLTVDGQKYIREEATGNYIPATPENVSRETELALERAEQTIAERRASEEQFIEDTGERIVVVKDGEIIEEFDPEATPEVSEFAPEGTLLQDPVDAAFDQANRLAETTGGSVEFLSDYQSGLREEEAQQLREQAKAGPDAIEFTPEQQQQIDVIEQRESAVNAIVDAANARTPGTTHQSRILAGREMSPFAKKLRAMGRRVGLDVVITQTEATRDGEQVESTFTGVLDPNDSRRIILDDQALDGEQQSQRAMLSVMGHEFFHSLEKESPELVDALMATMPSGFRSALQQYRATGMLGLNPTQQQQVSEGFAQLLENTLLGLGTESLLNKDVSRVQRIKDFIRRMLTRLGLSGQYGRDVLNIVEQLTGGKTLDELEISPRQQRRGERLRERAARRGPTQPETAAAPETVVTEPKKEATQFAAAPPVQSPEFRRWFKNSEIVNEKGEPRLAFHGTKKEFSEFRPRFDNGLMFFTYDSQFASDWMRGAGGPRQPSDEVIAKAEEMRVYEEQLFDELGIRDIDPNSDAGLEAFVRIQQSIRDRMVERFGFKSYGVYEDVGGTRVMPVYLSVQKLFDPRKHWNLVDLRSNSEQYVEAAKRGNWLVYEHKDIVDQIKALGFDGMLLSESALEDSPLDTVAVFDSTQVKSATANVGTYDPGDPDIRFAAARSNPLVGMSESEFRRTYSQHIDLRHRKYGGGVERIPIVQEQGWKPGFGVNTLPISMGTPPLNVIEEHFNPRIGDVVYLVPNSWVSKGVNGWTVKAGWKPKDYEVLVINQDNPNIYEIATSLPSTQERGDIQFAAAPSVKSPEFRRWFKNSRVVDDQGEPLVVYHGTAGEDFSVFQLGLFPGNEQYGPGHYFARNPSLAGGYTAKTDEVTGRQDRTGGRVYPAYISLQNPYVVDMAPEYTSVSGQTVTVQQTLSDIEYPSLSADQVRLIVENMPDKSPDGPLSNWGDVNYEGYEGVVSSVVDAYADNPNAFLQMGNDLFPDSPNEYLKAFTSATGYDGIVVRDVDARGKPGKPVDNLIVVAFNSTQIKSATANVGAFGQRPVTEAEAAQRGMTVEEAAEAQERGDIQFAARPTDERQLGVFYSQLGRVMRGAKQRKWDAGALRAYLVKNGVKQEEMYWTGMEDYLKENPRVDLDEAMDAIGGVQLEERLRAGRDEEIEIDVIIDAGTLDDAGEIRHEARGVTSNRDERFYEIFHDEDAGNVSVRDERGNWLDINAPINNQTISNAKQAIEEDMDARYGFEEGVSPVQFESYTLPGGEDYQELTISMRSAQSQYDRRLAEIADKHGRLDNPDGYANYADPNEVAELTALAEKVIQEKDDPLGFMSHAYDEPNILVWTRFNTRRGPNGEKILFIEEIQSDWHQKGREQGYKGESLALQWIKKKDPNGFEGEYYEAKAPNGETLWIGERPEGWSGGVEGGEFVTGAVTKDVAIRELKEEAQNFFEPKYLEGVPDAPFKKTWPDLALKRLIGYAVGQDFDGIAWTTGEQQARRYEKIVAENVDEIIVTMNERGNYTLGAMRQGRGETWDVQERELNDYIGKEMATEVRDRMAAGERSVTIPTENFRVGGKGMEVFYDNIVPQAANKIGKKFGTKVERQEMETGTQPTLLFPEKLKGAVPEFTQFAARQPKRTPSKKEQVRWLTGQRDRGTPESRELRQQLELEEKLSAIASDPKQATQIARKLSEEKRRLAEDAKIKTEKQKEKYTTAAKGLLQTARNRLEKLKAGYKDIEKMRRELRGLMEERLSPRVRGNYLAMLTNVRTEKQMKVALQRIILAAAKSGWSDEVNRYRRAVKRVNRHKKIPSKTEQEENVPAKLKRLIGSGKSISEEKVLIASGPNKGKKINRKKVISGVENNVDLTLQLAKITDEILETLVDALETKRVTKEGRGIEIQKAITETVDDISESRKLLRRTVRAGGEKMSARDAQERITTSLYKRALLWHRQIPNIVKVITGKPDGNSVLHKLFVDDFRSAESKMEKRKHEIIQELEKAALDAGFKSLEDATVKLDASHGLGLSGKLIKVKLGGQTIRLLPGELLHLGLMDPDTVEQIINGNVPLKVARGGESAVALENITEEEFADAVKQIDPNHLRYGNKLKEIMNSLQPDMFRVLRNLQGYDPELVIGYFPVSRDLSETKFGSEQDMKDMLTGKTGMNSVAVLYAENSGQTKSRVANKNPIFIKPATNTFSQHVDTTLRIIYMAEAVRAADAVTINADVKNAIVGRYGAQMYQALRRYLAEASGVNDPERGGIARFFSAMTSNLAGSYIALNPGTMMIQFSGIPRLIGRLDFKDIVAGIAWATANMRGLSKQLEQSGYFAERWSRSTITRFGPQKYGGLVPVNKAGFERGVKSALASLARLDLKSASRSWQSANDSIQFLDAIDRYIVGIAYGAWRSKAKRESPLLSEQQLHERALREAEVDIRETQNSSSPLDHSSSASSWRRNAIGESFLLFSSDRFTLLNRLAHGKRLLLQGKKREGARIITGSLMSMASEVPIRYMYASMLTAAATALFVDQDDDRKRAERAAAAEEYMWTTIVRSITGISPIFGGIIETAGSVFVDKMYSDAFLSSAAGDAISNIARNGKRAVNEFMKMTDDEQVASVEVAISSTVNMLSQMAAITTGNPFHPLVNKGMRSWAGTGNDPVSDLDKLDAYYQDYMNVESEEKGQLELTPEQRAYAEKLAVENEFIQREMRKLRKDLKQAMEDESEGYNMDAEINRLLKEMAEQELEAMRVLGYSEDDIQDFADEKGISIGR